MLFGARTGQAAQRLRLRTLMGGTAAVLGLLAIIFGRFHLDFATERDKHQS